MMRRIGWPVVILLLAASCAPVKTVKLPPPFKSTPDEEKNVDRLLARWERWNAGVKTFDCRFTRWTYDSVFGRSDQPRYVDRGTIKYAAPDRGLFRIETTEKDGKQSPIEDVRAEHWAFDGKSIFEVNSAKMQVIEHRLPPGVDGSRPMDSPLPLFSIARLVPFFFGSPASPFPFCVKAKELKAQCYIRETTPADQHDQIWFEAYPRSSQFGCAFQKLQWIFRTSDMSPYAMKMVQPNGKDYIVYQFFDIAVNSPSTPGDDPFHPVVPLGWQKKVEGSSLLAWPAGQ